jgi:hypothetical protein
VSLRTPIIDALKYAPHIENETQNSNHKHANRHRWGSCRHPNLRKIGAKQMKTRWNQFVRLGMLLLCLAPGLHAGVPHTLTYQGTLMDNTGEPVSGPKDITLRLYTVPTGGTPFWSEEQQITIDKGRFSALLGANASENPLDPADFNGETYIGLQVGTDEEMPRQELSSVAYALKSGHALTSDHAAQATTAITAQSAQSALTSDNAAKAQIATRASSADSAKKIDIGNGEGPICIFATHCPSNYVRRAEAGFIVKDGSAGPAGVDNCPYRGGGAYNDDGWYWCHPDLCCMY